MTPEDEPNGHLPPPASQETLEAGERTFDTGPDGLGQKSKPKARGKSRKEHPESRDRGHRSSQYNGRDIR